MKINNIKILFLSLLAAVFVCSCDKDDSPFSGEDNYISSFQLKQGEITLNAAISNGSIVITAPENFSLNGATATATISENANISPNPSSITNWNDEQTFTVTAYNGTKSIYKYTIQRNVIAKDGDITLFNQADVEALAALNLSQINGSLTIGAATGQDSVLSLAPLTSLKTIKYGLVINATYAGSDLSGLENLEKIGGFQIQQNNDLKTVFLPKLTSVMSSLIVNQSLVRTLNFPELANIDRSLQITASDSLVQMNFPKLKNIVEDLSIQGSWGTNKLQSADFPVLEKVGGNINISNWKEVAMVNMPLLTSATSVSVSSLAKMTSLTIPKLKATLGSISISANTLMTTMDFSSLQSVGGDCKVENLNELENMNGLKALSSIGGEAFISSLPKLKNIQGLKALKSIEKRAYFSNWPLLEDETLSGLSNLNSIGGDIIISQIPFKCFTGFALKKASNLSIYGNGLSSIQEIDIRNLDVENTLTLSNISTPFVLKGKNVSEGTLYLESSNLTAIEGFGEVKNLTYYMDMDTQAERVLNIRKVTENMTLTIYNFNTFKMPLLEEVGGKFNLLVYSGMQIAEFPALKKIVGEATMDVSGLQAFSLPMLQSVGGNCNIVSGRYESDNLDNIQMPSLTTVNGTLSISGYSNYYPNSKLTNLNGFTALKNVKGITVEWNTNLTDFTGLKNALSSFGTSNWKISNNNYNPTYQDMVDGKFIKP